MTSLSNTEAGVSAASRLQRSGVFSVAATAVVDAGNAATASAWPRESAVPQGRRSAHLRTVHPAITAAVLVGSDLASFGVAVVAGYFSGTYLTAAPLPDHYWSVAAAGAVLCVLLATKMRLYPPVALQPTQELRKLASAVLLSALAMLLAWSWLDAAGRGAAAAFSAVWVGATVLVCFSRVFLYHVLSERRWWGCPVVVIGKASETARIIRILGRQPQLNLKPVAVLDSSKHHGPSVEGVPVVGGLERAHAMREHGIRYAVVATPRELTDSLAARLNDRVDDFPHLLVIPKGVQTAAGGGTIVRNLGGVVGVELAPRLLQPVNQYLKAGTDVVLSVALFVLALPLFALIAILIKLDSPGPIFYRHTRIGFGGRKFKAIKFRTMVVDAESILKDYLRQHPELKQEWSEFHKLRDDPRITRVGRLLRKPSLDELPQLWNVFKGEMSLIGPRPIVRDEVRHFGRAFGLYVKVKPGITGLWQVSGRSDTTYRERVCLDAYYVRNWTIWMDLYILARTAVVVLFGKGAY